MFNRQRQDRLDVSIVLQDRQAWASGPALTRGLVGEQGIIALGTAPLALRMRCSKYGRKAAEVVAVARPRPRGVPKNPNLAGREEEVRHEQKQGRQE